ncbi:bifunctional adenosylcobinamide kinase/adenosylcobinamide-phosphate guanylyltransferase [Paractinoplanes lichenicola]|uniref:Adenosylcobinamide kinase n=1 Tax=Paractinoplanes lichenicola TaxID=2802976 RepID=A0ABS1VNX6_9ACTN|nr:bifunctional adenosylcobinamide kinase/adenosylcobinamide-phosphate guanylyltransferase [Actinoplanes lichenicola]MBL7256448.1 bifunctional adenosylcobinamide kinase/adenosylcobinamide-phosphate guanylyltransferase [Actinoplanes lichenicola]
MSDDRWHTVLVLGGIRSGKSEFAESLVADAPAVRYVATAAGGEDDPEWLGRIEAHQRRRPQSWSTEETGADPARLTELLTEAKPDDTLLVDDLGGWVAAVLDPARQPNDDEADVAALAAAVRACTARVVLVSPEVGLSLVAATPVGRAFTDALGTTNQALADACDRVALVVAGRVLWLKEPGDSASPLPASASAPPLAATAPPLSATAAAPTLPASASASPLSASPPNSDISDLSEKSGEVGARENAEDAGAPSGSVLAEPVAEAHVVSPVVAEDPSPRTAAGVLNEPTMVLPLVASRTVIEAGMELPLPDSDAGPDARDRLATVDFPGAGLGRLVEAVEFAAATQSTVTPQPWSAPRVLLLSGRHAGGAAAGDDVEDVERRVAQVEAGEGVLSRLAGSAGADIAVLRTEESAAIEDGPAATDEEVERALLQGWHLADAAAEAGKDLLVLASIGAGTDAVATAVSVATTGSEAVAVLPRVLLPGGVFDDESWMLRCAAVRDALHRIRREPRGAKDILRELGGHDLAVATGALLGAAARRLPVVLDGPVGIAAGLIARDLASQTRHWSLLVDTGDLELVRQGGDVLGLNPVLELGLGLGEGANALAALPLLRTAVGLASAVGAHPALAADPENDSEADFVEPEPDGPGPAST